MPIVGDGAEAHWGDPGRSQSRQVFGRGEVPMALAWLTVAALVGLLLEIVYLGTWVRLGPVAVPVPWTIAVAYVLNLVIAHTALLWTERPAAAAAPALAWVAGFVAVLAWQGFPFGGDQAMPPGLRMLLLAAAGCAGGFWPVLRRIGAT